MESTKITKENKFKDRKIIALFVLSVLIIILTITKIANLATPKKVFDASINKVFKILNKNSNNEIKTITGNFGINVNIDDKNNKLYSIINDLNLKLDYGIDYNNNKINLRINPSYQNKDLLKANLYANEKKAFIYLDKIFDKFIEIPLENYNELFNNNHSQDLNIVLGEIENSLKNSLKNKYFKSEKTSLTINNKKVSLTKNTLNMNKDNQKLIAIDIAKSLNTNKFISSLSNLTKKNSSNIKNHLEEIIKGDIKTTDDYTISIYTKSYKKEFKAFEINNQNYSIFIIKDNTNKLNYSINIAKIGTVNGSIINKNKQKYSLEITFNNNQPNITININTAKKYNEDIADIETTNSIPYNKLTEKDHEQITENFLKSEAITELVEKINNLFSDYSLTNF